jgi:hypothetical protein
MILARSACADDTDLQIKEGNFKYKNHLVSIFIWACSAKIDIPSVYMNELSRLNACADTKSISCFRRLHLDLSLTSHDLSGYSAHISYKLL